MKEVRTLISLFLDNVAIGIVGCVATAILGLFFLGVCRLLKEHTAVFGIVLGVLVIAWAVRRVVIIYDRSHGF